MRDLEPPRDDRALVLLEETFEHLAGLFAPVRLGPARQEERERDVLLRRELGE